MEYKSRSEMCEMLLTAGLRFRPGVAAGTEAIAPHVPEVGSGVDVQALLERLAALNEAPRTRMMRSSALLDPVALAPVA